MAFRWQWLLVLLVLWLGGERSFAATARENRAYAAAVGAFQDGMWSRAETEFARFIEKYPKSDRMSEAVLTQAEAEFEQGKLGYDPDKLQQAIALLMAHRADAGNLADEYAYWIGEAQYQGGDFSAAAASFVSLARDFPGSSLRLQAVVEAAAARSQLKEWPQLTALLEETNGVFQNAVRMDPARELVTHGNLLLAQAKFAQNDFAGAASVLGSLNPQTLTPERDWQRAYLLYQVRLAAGDANAALAVTTNLVEIAQSQSNDVLRAEGWVLRAGLLEHLGQKTNAIAAYQEILKLDTPPLERARQAILKIAELSIAQNQLPAAEKSLENFLAQFPGSAATDVALLTLGELLLKDYVARPAATNLLPEAQARFDQFLGAFPTNPLAGKAYLDSGWSLWLAGKVPDSFDAFKVAAQRLPPSEDQAVAKFKMGDALFAQADFAHALENYRAVVDDFRDFPTVLHALGDRALYQMLRADLELTNYDGASNAMVRILTLYPGSDLADNSLLLVGEGLTDARQPAAARAIFQKFVELFPNSPLRPEVELAVARTFEQEQNWSAAISQYESWRNDFSTNARLPQADYALAQANFKSGQETNAFGLFTNFVAQFPTNDLAPLAQWWVADHYFRLGGTNYVDAERNYKMLYQDTNWQGSPLIYQARLMAGYAAMGLSSYADAIDHFKTLFSDTNCPPDLSAQALFDYGNALMLSDSTDTNNPLANFQMATAVFSQLGPTNEIGVRAWNEIGDCDLQLTNYDGATNAYAQVFNAPSAGVSARSRAQIGFGIALEKKAALVSAPSQNDLLEQALDNYLDVFGGLNLRDGEQRDFFWVKKAGLQAAPLVGRGRLNAPEAERNFYGSLKQLLPQLADLIDRKIAALPPGKN